MVEIQHDPESMTRYAHLSRYADGLAAGDCVKAGDRIGAVGATGLATGRNLHYEVRYAGRAVDPLAEERVAALAGDASGGPADDVLPKLGEALAAGLRSEPAA